MSTKEHNQAYMQEYRKSHKEYQIRYYNDHKKEINKKYKEWYKENKDVDRERHLKRKYGISNNDYEKMIILQNGKCAICGNLPTPNTKLHVDHDHQTGKIRKLLCKNCNNALGYAREDISILDRMIDYLNSHKD